MSNIYKTSEGQALVEERYRKFLNFWPQPNRQFHVPTSQGETFVIASGDESAPPLFLLHGSAANSVTWMADTAVWSKSFRVFAIDVIGEPGLSAPSRPPLSSAAYAAWLDDVRTALHLDRISLVGVSLGGWLALDYATRHPESVESLALISPAGIGRQKFGILLKIALLKMCGAWGTRKLRESILGRTPADTSPAVRKFTDFIALIHEHFRPRMSKIPIAADDALQKLAMPMLVVVGATDVMLDSAETRARLTAQVPHCDVRYLPDTGHFIRGQAATILEFLAKTPVAQ